jgi:four helix bundle protein
LELDVKDFRELKVWHKAHELTLRVYRATARFPREELFGLTAQLRRSAASIAANLAEGCGRNGNAELSRFCIIAMGSASELEYHLLLAKDLTLINPEEHEEVSGYAIEVKRMLAALIQKIRVDRRRQES